MMIYNLPTNARNSFVTFHHYIKNIAQFIEHEFGQDSAERYGNIFSATSKLHGSVTPRSLQTTDAIRRYLRAAMANLLCLHREANDDNFFAAKNAWTPAQGWYAVHNLMCALAQYVSPGVSLDHDRSCGNARQLICKRGLLPYPWAAYTTASYENGQSVYEFENFRRPPTVINNLAVPTLNDFEDSYGLFLSTTLRKRAERSMDLYRKRNIPRGRVRRNVSASRKRQFYRNAGPVTLINALYRLRIRANYGDVDTFVDGCRDENEARDFAKSLHIVIDATVTALESVLASYTGTELLASTYRALARRSEEETLKIRLTHHAPSE